MGEEVVLLSLAMWLVSAEEISVDPISLSLFFLI